MVRWTPATPRGGTFTIAEVAALGAADQKLLAASAESGERWTRDNKTVPDGKTVLDGKTFEAKDIPAEGPPEIPPPGLPQPPPFNFIPVQLPTPGPAPSINPNSF